MTRPLRLPAAVRTAIVKHARREAPGECCGFLLGTAAGVSHAWPATNTSTTPKTRYRVDPREHIALRRMLRRLSPPLAIVGVYHSHPTGPNEPSSSDIREAYVSEWAHVIVDLSRRLPRVTAWTMRNGRVERRRLAQ